MLTLEYAKNPIFSNEEHTTIHLTVKFVEIDEELPFGANDHDPMDYGRDIFKRAMLGEFGEIAPYVAPQVDEQK